MKKELEDIEKQIEELKRRKQEILDEEKNHKSKEQSKRKQEIQDAYDKFYKLLKAYGEDYNVKVKISYSCDSNDYVDYPAFVTW